MFLEMLLQMIQQKFLRIGNKLNELKKMVTKLLSK